MDEFNEVVEGLEPINNQDDPPAEKPIWGKLENCLSGCLAFTILIFFPIIISALLINDELPAVGNARAEIRQGALDENWQGFLDHRTYTNGAQRQAEAFELSLCPFAEDGNWNEEISPEEAGFICGYITVPLDHFQPTGETLQIPIAIWPSYEAGTQPDPLVITHGGPGASALEMYPQYFYPDKLGRERDLIFIDQRGTQYAEPSLICPEVTEDIYGAVNPGEEDGEDEDYQDYLNYCRARLAGKDISLAYFITPQIARDFEKVRETLGYENINFYGVSYGTHVGQYLGKYFPESIRTLILDGVAPVPLDYLNRSVSTRTRILNELFTDCDQDPICAENYPDLSNRLIALINKLDQNPEQVRLGLDYRFYPLELDGEFFLNYLFSIAYYDHNYALLPYIIKEAENNRFDTFKAWVDWRISQFSEESLAYYAVVCSEHQPFTQITQDNLDLGIPLISWENSDLEEFADTCQALGIQHSPDTLEALGESTLPTLLLSGNFDPITPPEYAEMALTSYPYGQHVVDPLGSHGIAFNDDCLDSILDQFLADPQRVVDPACLDDPGRREEVVPATALSSLFMLYSKDIPSKLIAFPIVMAIVIAPRYGIQGGKWIWRKLKKSKNNLSNRERRLRLRFELTNWIFGLCSLGLGVGLDHFDTLANRPYSYQAALALPEDARLLLLIPLIMVIISPVLIYFTIRIWKVYSAVLARVYLLLNTLLVLSITGILAFNNMLLTWTR